MTKSQMAEFSLANFSSNHAPSPHEPLPTLDENFKWGGASFFPQQVFFGFCNPHYVDRIVIPSISTDVTTEQFRVAVYLRTMHGSFYRIREIRETNIKRSVEDMDTQLVKPPYNREWEHHDEEDLVIKIKPCLMTLAQGLLVTMEGHGWFSMVGLPEVYGNSVIEEEVQPIAFHGGITVIKPE